jgi:hypothetical protein
MADGTDWTAIYTTRAHHDSRPIDSYNETSKSFFDDQQGLLDIIRSSEEEYGWNSDQEFFFC